MNVLLLIDADFAARERSMLRRVEVGLADEGVSVLHALPQTPRSEETILAARVVTFAPDRLGWTARSRTRAFLSEIEARYPGELFGKIDAVHVLGRRWWTFGASIARELDAGLVIEIWRHASIDRAGALHAKTPTVLLASDPAIHRDMAKAGLSESARPGSWGVYAAPRPNAILPTDRASSVMILGGRGDLGAIERTLQGIAHGTPNDDLMIFIDARLAPKTHLWRCARELKLLNRLSIIEDMEGERDLVLAGDILLIPSPDGENRSIVLDAMGHGMLVIAPRDPAIEVLDDPSIARLLPDPTPDAWSGATANALSDREQAAQTGTRAWEFVRERRKGAAHVASIIDAYEWLTSSNPLPFET